MSFEWKPKLKAFAIHFSISLSVFLVLLYFIVFKWYPQPFFSTDGGIQGLRLIVLVDLVLGPALTFVVFKRGKPGLKFDLTLIALTQIAALSWGTWSVHNEHPVAVVFADDRFNPIPYYQVIEAGISLADLKKFGEHSPVKIYVDIPDDTFKRYELFSESFKTRTPLYLYGILYRRIDNNTIKRIASNAIDMEDHLNRKGRTDKMRHRYQRFLSEASQAKSDYLFIALYARHGKFIAVVDAKTFDFVEVLDIPPPQVFNDPIKLSEKFKKKSQQRQANSPHQK